jgi:CysZ protein
MTIPSDPLRRFLAGAGLPPRGLAYLAAHPALLPYAAVPALLAALGIAAVLAFGVPLATGTLSLLWLRPEAWYWFALWWTLRAAIWLVFLVLAAFALPTVLSAPAIDLLSARVERLELGSGEAPGGLGRAAAETWRGVTNALVRVVSFTIGHVLLLLVLLVPVVNVAYPVLAFLWTARWTALEYLDLPMARHLHPLADVRAALRSVRPLGLGFGSVLALALIVPLANLLVVPAGAVAGTLLYCELVRAQRAPGAAAAVPAASRR